jgi:hypothetical protein
MPNIVPIITNAGLAAAACAAGAGLQATIAWVAIGDQGYVPGPTRTALAGERERVPVASGIKTAPTQIHIDARFASTAEFWVREVGYFLTDGTLFAVWSDPTNPIAYKPATGELILALDLSVAATPASSVTVTTGEGLAAALSGELADAVAKLKRAATAAGTTYPPGDDDAVRRTVQGLIDQSAARTAVTNTFTGDQFIRLFEDDRAIEGPGLHLRRTVTTPAANDSLAVLRMQGGNDAGQWVTYAKIGAVIVDPTAGAENGELTLHARRDGVTQVSAYIGHGLRVGYPTGGDMGAGTINAREFWENGKRVNGQGVARAWIGFNGQTLAIYDSFNVASVVHEDTGKWTINFITPQPHGGFVTVISVNNMGRNPTPWVVNQFPTGVTVRSAEILDTAVGTGNNLAVDPSVVTVAVFGDIP